MKYVIIIAAIVLSACGTEQAPQATFKLATGGGSTLISCKGIETDPDGPLDQFSYQELIASNGDKTVTVLSGMLINSSVETFYLGDDTSKEATSGYVGVGWIEPHDAIPAVVPGEPSLQPIPAQPATTVGTPVADVTLSADHTSVTIACEVPGCFRDGWTNSFTYPCITTK